MALKIYNTLTREKEDFRTLEPGKVRMYVCGPTVYDRAHIGHAMSALVFDIIRRYLEFRGYQVRHVMNFTDVDDKIILRANEKGMDPFALGEMYIREFQDHLLRFNILPATVNPRATREMDQIITMIKGLVDKGYAYPVDGDVYFRVSRDPEYGKLSGRRVEEMQAGFRIEVDARKENPMDFALWKAAKPGEPAWESPWGKGRPGWHIECSAMSTRYLGPTFDLHCGGIDNIFPHHENEIAQSEAYYGQKFVNYWLHCHHLVVNGEKMSKSKGNFFTLRDLLARQIDPVDLRYFLLSTHYRKMLNFTFDNLDQARASRQRIIDFVYELKHQTLPQKGENQADSVSALTDKALADFKASLADDLNISLALAAVFEFIREINSKLARNEVSRSAADQVLTAIYEIDKVLAILPDKKEEELPADILRKIEQREQARREKNFALADSIRQELLQQGIVLEDTREGVRWKKIK